MIRPALSLALTFFTVLVVAGVAAAAAGNGDLSFVSTAAAAPGAYVVDVRKMDQCSRASLPKARCLPMDNFVGPSGAIIGFHALRWLLGTVGLSGAETVLVVGADTADAKTVGRLLYVAGQRRVRMLKGALKPAPGAPAGQGRSMSREVIYTAAMRDGANF